MGDLHFQYPAGSEGRGVQKATVLFERDCSILFGYEAPPGEKDVDWEDWFMGAPQGKNIRASAMARAHKAKYRKDSK